MPLVLITTLMSYPGDSTTGSTGLNDLSTALDYGVVFVVMLAVGVFVVGALFTIGQAVMADYRTKKK